jgi:carboxylate-amine ligase
MAIEFARSARSTIGMEWEVAIVDRATGELASVADRVLEVLDAGSPGEHHPFITAELLTNTVELVSAVHTTVADTVADLEGQLAEVRAVIDELGDYELICSGSHPFSQWYHQQLTDKARYHKLIERTRWWGRNMMIWGVHVHVGIEDRDKALPILDGLLAYLPHLQALSASSPFWAGVETGYASNRALMFQQLPTAGLPYPLADWAATNATSTTSCAPASSRTTARCDGTSARRRVGAPSRCGCATACRPLPRSAPSARSCSASSSG